MRRPLPALLLVLLVLAGCGDSTAQQRQPGSDVEGLRATGRLDGARVAVSRGNPDVVDGDCDPNEGLDEDLCLQVRTIDGVRLNLVIENPGALVAGEQLAVDERDCGTTGCDDVRDVAVVDLRVDGVQRPVESGQLDVRRVDDRVAAEFDLGLGGADRLTGEFDVPLPRAEPILGPDAGTDPAVVDGTPVPSPSPTGDE